MPADTFSPTIGFLVMGTGNDNNTWGTNANTAVFQIFEDAIANPLTSAVTGGTLDLSGTPPPSAASQVRYAALIFTGVLGSNQIVQVPNLTKFWWVKNATSGGSTLTFKTPSGAASTAIPQNSGWQRVYCDGANNIVVDPFNSVQVQMPDGSASAPAYSDINETNSGWYRFGTQDWRFSINGSDVFRITGAGAGTPSIVNVLPPNVLQVNGLGIISQGGTFQAADGTVSAPGVTFNSETGSGLYRIGLGDYGFSILESKRIEITSIGYTWLGSTFAGSDLSPTSISTNQNNYNPAGLGLVLTLGAITGGSLYTPGTYKDVPLTGGTGTGARATITVNGGGAVSIVTLTCRGINFVAADTLSAAAASIGGTGSGFSVPVSTVDAMTASCLRLNVTAACSMTGLAGGSAGRELELLNIGSATLQCPANSGTSSAANRFANTFNLVPGQSITLRYDATSSLWRPKNVATAFSSCCIAAVSPDLLIINHVGTESTKLDITANEAVLIDASGNGIKFENISVTIDSTTTGPNACDTGTRAANAKYFEWLMSDGVTIAGVLSLSSSLATVVTNLAGSGFANYIYGKRVGAQFTDASSNFFRVTQKGREAIYVVTTATNTASMRQMASGVAGDRTIPTWVPVAVGAYVPLTALSIKITLAAGTSEIAIAAPNNSYGGYNSTSNPPPVVATCPAGLVSVTSDSMLLETTNIYWASGSATGAVYARGWTDNI